MVEWSQIGIEIFWSNSQRRLIGHPESIFSKGFEWTLLSICFWNWVLQANCFSCLFWCGSSWWCFDELLSRSFVEISFQNLDNWSFKHDIIVNLNLWVKDRIFKRRGKVIFEDSLVFLYRLREKKHKKKK